MTLREELIDFVLDAARNAPVHKRIHIYRGLADVCGIEEEHDRLCEIANSLESAEKQSLEFQFNLKNNFGTPRQVKPQKG